MRRGLHQAHRAGWRNAKHAAQWESTLETYAEPVIGALPVQAIDTGAGAESAGADLDAKPETAGRVRGRIECGPGLGKVRGYRDGRKPGPLARPPRQAAAGR